MFGDDWGILVRFNIVEIFAWYKIVATYESIHNKTRQIMK